MVDPADSALLKDLVAARSRSSELVPVMLHGRREEVVGFLTRMMVVDLETFNAYLIYLDQELERQKIRSILLERELLTVPESSILSVCWFTVKWTKRPGDLDSRDGQDTVGFFAWGPERTGKQGGIVPPLFVPDARPALGSCPHGALSSGRVFGFSHPHWLNAIELAD